jgi:hypothetical protein
MNEFLFLTTAFFILKGSLKSQSVNVNYYKALAESQENRKIQLLMNMC